MIKDPKWQIAYDAAYKGYKEQNYTEENARKYARDRANDAMYLTWTAHINSAGDRSMYGPD